MRDSGSRRSKSPDVQVRSIPLSRHELKAWTSGGVHVPTFAGAILNGADQILTLERRGATVRVRPKADCQAWPSQPASTAGLSTAPELQATAQGEGHGEKQARTRISPQWYSRKARRTSIPGPALGQRCGSDNAGVCLQPEAGNEAFTGRRAEHSHRADRRRGPRTSVDLWWRGDDEDDGQGGWGRHYLQPLPHNGHVLPHSSLATDGTQSPSRG